MQWLQRDHLRDLGRLAASRAEQRNSKVMLELLEGAELLLQKRGGVARKHGNGLPLDGVNGLMGVYLQPLASSVQDLHCGNGNWTFLLGSTSGISIFSSTAEVVR